VKHLIPEFEELKKRLPPGLNSVLVLPCLRRIQDDRGYIADEDVAGLVDYLGVPRIQIEEVLSFYTMLRRKPIGRWHVRLIDHLAGRLGVKPGETTADGRFTLSTVECLGSCGTAPVVMVNERYHELQDAQSLDALIEGLKQS
jgi:NADH-quinone oxidoreductase subunit E